VLDNAKESLLIGIRQAMTLVVSGDPSKGGPKMTPVNFQMSNGFRLWAYVPNATAQWLRAGSTILNGFVTLTDEVETEYKHKVSGEIIPKKPTRRVELSGDFVIEGPTPTDFVVSDSAKEYAAARDKKLLAEATNPNEPF